MSEENNNEQAVTEEQLKTLQQLKDEREQHIKERQRLEASVAHQEAELRKLQLENAVEREFDAFSRSTGVRFNGRHEDIFKLMRDQYDVKQSEDGSTVALVRKGTGDPVAFADALESFSIENSYWCSNLGVLRPEAERVQCRDDFRNDREKIAWIGKHGLPAFEQLPPHRLEKVSVSQMSAEDFHKLTLKQKSDFVGLYGIDGVAAVCSRKERK